MYKIPQFAPYLGQEEKDQLCDCIDKNWITAGAKVKAFEQAVAEKHGVKYAVAICNGTLALWAILKSLNLGKPGEVIVPDFTFIATAGAVSWAGGTPVFVDINRDTLQIDPEAVERAITDNTRVIMPVNIYGKNYDVEAISKIAQEHDLIVIEDAAQAFGVSYNGKMAGSFGTASMISFFGDKTLTTAEGGMVLTDYKVIADRVTMLKNQGNMTTGNYINETLGTNLRMSDLHAAVGLAQLTKFDYMVKRKLEIYNAYNIRGVNLLPIKDGEIPFRVICFVKDAEATKKKLAQNSIEVRRVFYPLHCQPYYLGTEADCPNSIWAYEHGLALPSSVNLTDEEIEEVCQYL